jgi:hypothetical protein
MALGWSCCFILRISFVSFEVRLLRLTAAKNAYALGLAILVPTVGHTTISGPSSVLQCPDSSAVVLRLSLLSGNNFGATYWSDGESWLPMMPKFPQITRCGDAGRIFWVEDAVVLGKIAIPGDGTQPSAWEKAVAARFLSEEEYLDAVATGVATTPKRLVQLRILAWRAANDCALGRGQYRAYRQQGPSAPALPCRLPTFPEGSRARGNLEALVDVFHVEGDNALLLRVEMLRELGRFAEAQTLLATAPASSAQIAHWMQDRINRKDDKVAVLDLK